MKQIFINLPVQDLEKSMQFYLALGFTLQTLFTSDDQKCMRWSDEILVMLQSRDFINAYLHKDSNDSTIYQTASHTLPVESIQKVNEMVESAIEVGGKEPVPPLTESFMYLRSIQDTDGYIWGIMYLDEEKFKMR